MQVFQLKKALCSLDKNYAAQDEKYTCMSLTRNDI
jgi:ribonuclease H2 subunit B